MSVQSFAIQPPVQDSAVTSRRPDSRRRAPTSRASAARTVSVGMITRPRIVPAPAAFLADNMAPMQSDLFSDANRIVVHRRRSLSAALTGIERRSRFTIDFGDQQGMLEAEETGRGPGR